MVEIGRFDDDSTRIGNTQKTTPAVNENSGISKQELGEKIRTAFKTGKKAEISEDVLNTLNKIRLKVPPKNADIYANRVAKEETSITNLIERGKEPLKRPNENPTFVMDNGPHGGKLEQFPQRANGTYRTIETLPNGETYECTYSQNGILLNEIKREGENTQITTFNGKFYDKVSIFPIPDGITVVGKIQAGNFLTQEPPTLQDVTGRPLTGFMIKS